MTTRLLLVDDHAVVRSGLRMLLGSESDVDIVGEAESDPERRQVYIDENPTVGVFNHPSIVGRTVAHELGHIFLSDLAHDRYIAGERAYAYAQETRSAGRTPRLLPHDHLRDPQPPRKMGRERLSRWASGPGHSIFFEGACGCGCL